MEKYRFPQCFGVVDGSHIPIVSPQYYPADYYNRKGWHSVILQGTVNHLGQFIDVNVGWPGRVHDARVFSILNSLMQFFPFRELNKYWQEFFCDYCTNFLYDDAYSRLGYFL